MLDVSPEVVHFVVVFAGESTSKSPMPDSVNQGGGYIRYIKSFSQPVLSESEVQQLLSQIQADRLAPTPKIHRRRANGCINAL